MSRADKVIRITAATVILVLYACKLISGNMAIILLMAAGIFILTSFFGVCPLYSICRIRTNKR